MPEETALSARIAMSAVTIPKPSRNFALRAFDRWKQAAHAVGVVQTRFLMLVIYVIVVVPTGLLMRLSRDPLHLRPPAQSNFTQARQSERSVESARQQF